MSSVSKLGSFVTLQAVVTKTATFNSTGIDVSQYIEGLTVRLTSAAGTGTTPTMDVKLQDSATVGGTYADITGATFTQVVDAAAQESISINVGSVKEFVRAVATIAGGTPSFTYAIEAFGQKQQAG